MRPVHPKVPSEAEPTIGPLRLRGISRPSPDRRPCPFDINAWRILHPPKRRANCRIFPYFFFTGIQKTTTACPPRNLGNELRSRDVSTLVHRPPECGSPKSVVFVTE